MPMVVSMVVSIVIKLTFQLCISTSLWFALCRALHFCTFHGFGTIVVVVMAVVVPMPIVTMVVSMVDIVMPMPIVTVVVPIVAVVVSIVIKLTFQLCISISLWFALC